MKHFKKIMLALSLSYACQFSPAWAEDTDVADVAESASKSAHFQFTLAKVYGDDQPVMLRNTTSQTTFSLPVPALWTPEKVTLNLRGTASMGLIERSQLAVLVNGEVVKQYPLKTADQRLDFSVPIPVTLLKPGFNQVKLMVSQHYADICEFTEDPSLWTQINLLESDFQISARPSNLNATLDQLNGLFDKASWTEQPVIRVMTANTPTQEELTAMSLVAQGIGQRYDFAPVVIQHATFKQLEQHAHDANQTQVSVLLGSHAALQPYLAGLPGHAANKPVIAIKRLSEASPHYLVILASSQPEGLRELATAFALKGVPWPKQPVQALSDVRLPNTEKLEQRFSLPLAPSGAFPLRALEFRTTTYTERDAEGATVRIWNTSWQGRMQVRLHLHYASGMSTQSALNVMTNGVMHGTIPLNNEMGGTYENYAVTIPSGALKPGWNTIQFLPKLIPQSNGGKCQPFFNGNLGLTIYEDSTIQKFGGDELIKPDLALYSGKGSLFTEGPLGKGIAFHLTDLSSETLSSGLTLVSKLTQMFERPLLKSTFTDRKTSDARQQFWVGPYAKLPANIQKIFSGSLPQNIQLNIPLIQSATFQVKGSVTGSWDVLDSLGLRRSTLPQFTGVDLKLAGGLTNMSFIASDLVDDSTITVLTAQDASTLEQGVRTLTDYGHWPQLQGSFAYWHPAEKEVYSASYADAPFSAYGLRGGIGLWVSQHPWPAFLLILIFIVGFALVIRKGLSIYQQRKHRWIEEV